MKPLAIWIAAVVVVFGGFVLVTTLTRSTERVFVVVDSSFPMRSVWTEVPDELDRIGNRDHTEFAVATEKQQIHSYQSDLEFSGVDPFAPCDFTAVESYPEAAEADELILVTTADSCPTDQLTDWTIVTLTP